MSTAATPPDTFRFGRFELRPAQRLLLADGAPLAVGARAFDLLSVLLTERERVVPHGELLARVWPGLVVEENNLRQHVSGLRKLLGAQAVTTVAGRGYRFTLPLHNGPALHGAPAATGPGLPANKPTLIGREDDPAAVLALLADTHLLTLVGSGGVGKTRMALEVADRVGADFSDGVCFVELAPVTDPSLIVRTVASLLDIHEEATRPLLDTLLDVLRRRRMLLILDNCEHLIERCAAFAEQVLRHSAATRTLATSREALGVAGEVAWRLPSLRTAPAAAAGSIDDFLAFPASRLFLERARAVAPAFRLTPLNVGAAARVCHQLDGIALALELAAARVGALTVEQLAERLDDRFALLSRSRRTVLQRHQTLHSLIDWSHELLGQTERVLLRRLSQFAGGWSLDGAEAVCSAPPIVRGELLDLLAQLVEKSLVVLDTQGLEPGYRLLETIRQYGLDKLMVADELDATRCRHLSHHVELAERIRPMLTRTEQLQWHQRAETELDNFRLALQWSLRSGQAEEGLRLFSSLTRFWYKNMHWKEMVGWQDRLAAACRREGRAPSLHYARSFYGAAMLATNFDPPLGRRLCEQCIEVSRPLDFDEGLAWSLMWMGYIDTRQRNAATAQLFENSLMHGRRIADPWRQAFLLAQALICYAGYQALMGRDKSAEAMVADCEAEIAKIGRDKLYIGHGRALLGTIAIRRGQFDRAHELFAESLALYQAVDSTFDIAGSLAQQGFLALRRNDPAAALTLFRQSLPMYRNYPTSPGVTRGLAQLLIALAACGQSRAAPRLGGVLGSSAAPAELSGAMKRAYEEALAQTRRALNAADFARELEAGRAMDREAAIEFALVAVA
ncbi:MAG: winged helix-turn-helix domain-containing protein [Rubrivivax sp.]|nr:winged helix-turn-helix domain-containing protein [Rubrivivax sp.]